jgi:hypothetical protein
LDNVVSTTSDPAMFEFDCRINRSSYFAKHYRPAAFDSQRCLRFGQKSASIGTCFRLTV